MCKGPLQLVSLFCFFGSNYSLYVWYNDDIFMCGGVNWSSGRGSFELRILARWWVSRMPTLLLELRICSGVYIGEESMLKGVEVNCNFV